VGLVRAASASIKAVLYQAQPTPLPAAVDRRRGGCFVVKASNDHPLLFIYYRDGGTRRSLARLLTRDAIQRIAVTIAKLPELFWKS
jgi:hypothetical protein